MKLEPDRLLNNIVITSLTIFIALVVLMGAIIYRQISLQDSVMETHEILQLTIEDLEETTQDLQTELLEIQTNDTESVSEIDQWEEVDELLDDVDEQLDTIEQGIDDIELALDLQSDEEPLLDTSQYQSADSSPTSQLLNILAILVAVASITFAIFLAAAIHLQRTIHFEVH